MKWWQTGGIAILSSGRLGSSCWPVAPQLWQTSEQLWLLSWTTAAQPALLIIRQAIRLQLHASIAESSPGNRDLAFGASCGQNSTLGLNNCGFLPVSKLHPLGSPVSCPASLQQAEAITCYVNLICSHTRPILSTSR